MKKVYDERIEKESNKPAAVMFYVTTILLILCLIVKLALKLPLELYLLEVFSLCVSIIYVVADKIRYGILWIKEKDETIIAINNRILARGYMIDFWILIVGEYIFIMMFDKYFWWVIFYLGIIFITGIVFLVLAIKKGWLVWGGHKQKQTGIKEFKKRTIIGAIVFGIIMGVPETFRNGEFYPKGILSIIYFSVAWGVLFYFAMLALIKVSENKADKIVSDAESEDTMSEDIELEDTEKVEN